MRIDAHQHFWQLERGDYAWPTLDLTAIYRDFMPTDLEPHIQKANVSATVVVQATPTEAETRFLLALAKSTPFIAGVVGWVDMTAPDVADRLAALKEAGAGYLKGIRPMIEGVDDPNWILSPSLDPAFAALQSLNLGFDALVRGVHLEPLLLRLKQYPDLWFVIDHAAKPEIRKGASLDWFDLMAGLASYPNVMCKLSGLVTEAGSGWRVDDLAPVVDHVIDCFGPRRTMWGSDWPVVNLVADYSSWETAARRLLSRLSAVDQARVFGGTAADFYGIELPDKEV